VPQTQRLPHEVGGPTMGLRLVATTEPNNVAPLYSHGIDADASSIDNQPPEPARLYGLTTLAFLLHTPTEAELVAADEVAAGPSGAASDGGGDPATVGATQ
jgi:hypothetical protein